MSKNPEIVPARNKDDGDSHGHDHGHGHSHDHRPPTEKFHAVVATSLSGPARDVGTVGDGTSNVAAATTDTLDPKQPPSKQRRIVDRTQASGEQALEMPPIGDTTQPKISVSLQDLNTQPPEKPHFLVKQDGSIEMHGDPEKLNAKDIKVQIERAEGQIYPSDQQKKAADELVTYLSQRLKGQNPELARTGVEVNDRDAVVSPEARQREQMRQPAENAGMTPETQQNVGNMNRFRGGGSGEMPVRNTNDYYPERSVPRQANESDQQAQLKEAVAGLWNADRAKPYETVRKHPDGDHRVGRYGFSGRQIHNWLAGLDLGDPPDPAKIEELIKQGKLPKGFNVESLKKLQAMADKMGKGEAPTADDMKLLPKEMQETMATDMVNQYKQLFPDNPGAAAAAMMSGKPATELTQQDVSSPTFKQLEEAGKRLYDMAGVRQQSTNENDTMRWDGQGRMSIGDGRWLNAPAAQALEAAKADARAHGIDIRINSAGRTYEEQASLFARRGTPGVSRIVARPGTSNHEDGMAIDVANWEAAKPFLQKYGFVHGDGNGPIRGDLVHFKFVGNRNSNTRYA
jgi:LAS superfamily LD-carboxypeptidase LdcB